MEVQVIKAIDRAGRRVWVVTRRFRRDDGAEERYRRDASVQSRAGAESDDRELTSFFARHRTIAGFRSSNAPAPAAPPQQDPQTWGDAVKNWKQKHAPLLKPSTRSHYADILDGDHFAGWSVMPIANITADFLSSWEARLAKTVKAATRRNLHVVLRSVIRMSEASGLIDSIPKLPKFPKVGRRAVEAVSLATVETILNEAPPRAAWGRTRGMIPPGTGHVIKHLDEARRAARVAFALAAYAGLRRGEIRGLRWPDVDLKKRTITVRRSVSIKRIEDTPKSGNERMIPIAGPLAPLLSEDKKKADPFGLVCPQANGKMWSEAGLLNAYHFTCERLSLPRQKFHHLRAFFVSELLRRRVPPTTVQRLAGHSDLKTTLRYAEVHGEDLASGIAAFG